MSQYNSSNDTGVTNGDVDWLFRGKIKKPAKGADSSEDASLSLKSPKGPIIPSPSQVAPATGTNTTYSAQQCSNNNDIPNNEHSATSVASKSANEVVPTKPKEAAPEKSNSRMRSASLSSFGRKSLDGYDSSVKRSTSFGSDSKKTTASSSPSSPTASSHTHNPPLAASTTSSKKSLFSSISSKFGKRKSSAPLQPSNIPSSASSSSSSSSSLSNMTVPGGSNLSTSANKSNSSLHRLNTSAPVNSNANTVQSSFAGSSARKNPASAPSSASTNAKVQQQHPQPLTPQIHQSQAHPVISNSSSSSSPLSSADETKKIFGSLRDKVSGRRPSVSSHGSAGTSNSSSFFSSSSSSSIRKPPAPTTERIILNKNPNRVKVPIELLSNLKMKRVMFNISDLNMDPPQQIPSSHPKKGNVIIPDDLIGDIPRVSLGIANSNRKISTHPQQQSATPQITDKKKYQLAVEAQKKAMDEAKKHAQQAHVAAVRIANEVAGYKNSKIGSLVNNPKAPNPTSEIEPSQNHQYDHLNIDKPMHIHEHHFKDDAPEDDYEEDDIDQDVPLDMLYTRCCHLREILPIPATLKQLKGKSKPLHVLKFLNPRPTLIDILSFCDFVAISPIVTLIFDNVVLTNEMIKILLTSLAVSPCLEKLSLKNLMIDSEAWKYLGKFMLKSKKLLKLDLSQTKYRSDLSPEFYRFNMNWSLFVEVLKKRGGISELILTGIDFRYEDFQILINEGISLSTKRLGLASSNISAEKCQLLVDWINSPNSTCEGLDLGFNDLSNGQLAQFCKLSPKDNNLLFLSINSSNLNDAKEVGDFLSVISQCPKLRYLDLSCLKGLFPAIIPYFKTYLPKFPSLKRIHLDYNHLPSKSLAAVLTILPSCEHLIHVSLIGNDVSDIYGALYTCVKASKLIFNLDVDYDQVPEFISSKIALLLMRNMEFYLLGYHEDHKNEDDDLIFDGSMIAESAEKLLASAETSNEEGEEFSNRFLKKSLMKKTKVIRSEIHKTIDILFEKRNNGELDSEGKERLLRFCLLDSALEKIVNIFENQEEHGAVEVSPPTVSGNDSSSVLSDNSSKETSSKDIANDVFLSASTDTSVRSNISDKQRHHLLSAIDGIHDTNKENPLLEEHMHNLSKDLISGNEAISPELSQIQSSEIQYFTNNNGAMNHNIPTIETTTSEDKSDNGEKSISENTKGTSSARTANHLSVLQATGELPHQLAFQESKDGREISIDTTTGRPVLFRNISQTSVNGKKQEEEEGEIHKWGFFMQHKQLYPDETSTMPALPPPNTTDFARIAAAHLNNLESLTNTPAVSKEN